MSFCVSHRSALDKNIRHLYSGLPSDIRFRSYGNSKGGAMDVHDRVFQRHKRPPERFDTKFQEYVPAYGTRLPRAPAFRSVSPEEAKHISDRLSRPTVMSTIRHKSASSRPRNRSSSRRGRSEMSTEEEEGLSSRDGQRSHRKVSYRDWSDNESGVYYYEDEARKDISTDSNDQSMEETITDQHKQEDNDWMYREEAYSSSQDVVSESSEKNERTNSRLSSNNDNRKADGTEIDNDASFESEDKSKKSKTTAQGGKNAKSSSQPKRKLNILEQIMQARNTRQRQPNPKTQNGPNDSKRLNRRENVNNRLGYSPYREPMPYLYLMYGPPHKTKSVNQRNKSASQRKPSNKEAIKQHQTATKTYLQHDTGSRPQTRASSTRQRKEAITYQFRPDSRARLSEAPPKRSKSAPLYTEHPGTRKEQRNPNKRSTTQETQMKEKEASMKSIRATYSSGPHSAHHYYPGGKAKTVKKSTKPSTPRDSSIDSDDTVSTPRYENSTQNQEQNSQMTRAESSRSANRIYKADYETLCLMYNSNVYQENGKRYSSPTEMQKANKRLMKPTTAKKIRDRLRYAPDNDRNLSDPVKVVHEAVEGKRKKNDGRGRMDEGENEDEYEEEEDEGEEEKSVVEVKKKEVGKKKIPAKKQEQKKKANAESKKTPTGVDHKSVIRGRPKEQKNQRSNSGSSRSSASPEVDSRNNNDKNSKKKTTNKSRSSSRSSSPTSRKSSVSSFRSQTPTRSRSRSRSGSRSDGRSRSRSSSSSRRSRDSSKDSLKMKTRSSTSFTQPQSEFRGGKPLNQTSETEGEDSKMSQGDNEGRNYSNIDRNTEDCDENSDIRNSSRLSNNDALISDSTDHQTKDGETERDTSISLDSVLREERTHLANNTDEKQTHEYSTDYRNAGRGDEYQDKYGRGDDEREEGTKKIVTQLRGDTEESNPSPEASTRSRSPSPEVTYSVRKHERSQEEANDGPSIPNDESTDDETETGADLTLPTESSYSELKSCDKEETKESQTDRHKCGENLPSSNDSPKKDSQYQATSDDVFSENRPIDQASGPRYFYNSQEKTDENNIPYDVYSSRTSHNQQQYSPQKPENDFSDQNENQDIRNEATQSSTPTGNEGNGVTSQPKDSLFQQHGTEESTHKSQNEKTFNEYENENERQQNQDIDESPSHNNVVHGNTNPSPSGHHVSFQSEIDLDATWKDGT